MFYIPSVVWEFRKKAKYTCTEAGKCLLKEKCTHRAEFWRTSKSEKEKKKKDLETEQSSMCRFMTKALLRVCFVLFCLFFEIGSHSVAQASLELGILLPQSPECWD
jgi:hypothetical protein